ncbi:hypothetical protein EDD53_1794 [Pacificibacter maritimus]|uniref:Uncharacterized protein n=1 Tax=Pacificibacter maritimus TaxID=762213 RepID=A0A3N4UQY2_9RHOB|nr:hypothetical protein [Pacificibacter maritimus]RPE67387.1 hypothetical protein EDD53_1794 [Pacificibacter maritimus]
MIFLLLSLALSILAAPLLRPAAQGQGRIATYGFDGTGVIMGFALTAAVAALTSPFMGFGFVFAVILHEYGAAKACNIIGHDVARLRLVPLPFVAPPRTDHAFDDALEDSFAALYAPGLAVLPMVVSFGLFQASAPFFPTFSEFMRAIGIMTGAFNFIMLLPFLPFAGGRVVRAISDSFWPKMSFVVTIFMASAFLSAALRDQSIAMGILAAAGLQSLFHRKRHSQTQLSPNNTLLVMATYAFCLCVHFTGGWWLLNSVL